MEETEDAKKKVGEVSEKLAKPVCLFVCLSVCLSACLSEFPCFTSCIRRHIGAFAIYFER